MRPYVGPIILATLGVLVIAASIHGVRDKVLEKRSDFEIENMRKSLSGRSIVVVSLIFSAYAAYGLIASIWVGSQAWWAWLIALVVQVTSVYFGGRARRRFFEVTQHERWQPSELDVTRSRSTRMYLAAAVLTFVGARLAIPSDGDAVTWQAVVGLGLFALSLLSLCAAGWSTVWIFRGSTGQDGERRPGDLRVRRAS